jgi:hypothetical protein
MRDPAETHMNYLVPMVVEQRNWQQSAPVAANNSDAVMVVILFV